MKKIYFSRSKKKPQAKTNSLDKNINSDFEKEVLTNNSPKDSKCYEKPKKGGLKKGIKSTNNPYNTQEKNEKRLSRKINPIHKISKLFQNKNSISEKSETKENRQVLKLKNNVDKKENEFVNKTYENLNQENLSQKLSEQKLPNINSENKKSDTLDTKKIKFSANKSIQMSDSVVSSQAIDESNSITKLSKSNTLTSDSRNFDSESNSISEISKSNKYSVKKVLLLNKVDDGPLTKESPKVTNQNNHTVDFAENSETKENISQQEERIIRKKIKNLRFDSKMESFFPENEPSETDLFKASLRSNDFLNDKRKNHGKSQFINCNRYGKSNNSIPKEAFTIRKRDIKEIYSDSTRQPTNDYYKKALEKRLLKVQNDFYDKELIGKSKHKSNLLAGSKNKESANSYGKFDSSYSNSGTKNKKRKILIMKDPRLKEEIVKHYYIKRSNDRSYEAAKYNTLVDADSLLQKEKSAHGHRILPGYQMCLNDLMRKRSKSLNSTQTMTAVELKKIDHRKKNKITDTKQSKKGFPAKNNFSKMEKKEQGESEEHAMSVQTILEAESFSQFESNHSQYLDDLDRWRSRNEVENEPIEVKPEPGRFQLFHLNLDEYKIYGKISTTSYGMVLAARNGSLKDCAIKMIKKKYLQGDELDKIFDDGQKNLYVPTIVNKCPFFIQLHDIFQTNDHFYFVQELVDYVSLDVLMSYQGRFDESQVKFYSAGILLALNYLHRLNLTHRYLKLENVLVDKQGYPKVSDFGRSNFFFSTTGNWEKIDDLENLPNIQYTAPEVFCSSKYDRLVDYWSLGVCIQYMLTGKLVLNWRYLCDVINEMDQSYSQSSMSLIKGLLKINPFMRLGSGPLGTVEIMNHQFYKVFNWDAYTNKDYKVPTPNEKCRINVINLNEESYKDLKSIVKNKKKSNEMDISENYKLNRVIEASTQEITPPKREDFKRVETPKTDENVKKPEITLTPDKLETFTNVKEKVETLPQPAQQVKPTQNNPEYNKLEQNKPERNTFEQNKPEKIMLEFNKPDEKNSKSENNLSNMLIEIKNELERFKLNTGGALEIDKKKIETQNEMITKLMDLENKNFAPRLLSKKDCLPIINPPLNLPQEKPSPNPILKPASYTFDVNKNLKQLTDNSNDKNKNVKKKTGRNKSRKKKCKKRPPTPDSSISSSVSSVDSSTSEEMKEKCKKNKHRSQSSDSCTTFSEYPMAPSKPAEILNNPHQFILNSSPSTQKYAIPKTLEKSRYSGELRSNKKKKGKRNKRKNDSSEQSDS